MFRNRNERRRHLRIPVELTVKLKVQGESINCSLINISEGGMLVKVVSGAMECADDGVEGSAYLTYEKFVMDFNIYIIRRYGAKVAIKFLNQSHEQINFIQRIISRCL